MVCLSSRQCRNKNVKEDEVGEAYQFASAPLEAEMTGPSFTPDETTLFLSVQHPGEETEDINNPTSMWPHRKGAISQDRQ